MVKYWKPNFSLKYSKIQFFGPKVVKFADNAKTTIAYDFRNGVDVRKKI